MARDGLFPRFLARTSARGINLCFLQAHEKQAGAGKLKAHLLACHLTGEEARARGETKLPTAVIEQLTATYHQLLAEQARSRNSSRWFAAYEQEEKNRSVRMLKKDTMRALTPVLCEDETHHVTLASQTQAVERAIQAMHTHLDEELALEDLASVACLSPSHFHRVFRRLIGIPPGEFLAALRFQAARRLLLTTALSVTEICFEVGYTSIGSFTTHFTHRVGLSPRLLRQRAQAFEPSRVEYVERPPTTPSRIQMKNALLGRISAPATFQGTIYVGLFTSPIPQGRPVRCTRLSSPGVYLLHGIADGVYHLRAAAFPVAADLHSSLLPGEKMLVGNNASPLVIRHGQVAGDPDLVLHSPRLTDPPLVMGLPLL